jgi:hypothetical protein
MPPCEASAIVTVGLKWAPETGPNVRIRATSAAPVAMVFARRDRIIPISKALGHAPRTYDRREQQ